jgi:hypothetical protein
MTEKIWKNEIRDLSTELSPMHLEQLRLGEDNNEYVLNRYGYRSAEFIDSPEMIVAGCSMTYGEGVPDAGRWGNFLAKDLNVFDSYVNLGIRGASVGQIVLNVFAYIEKYGKPKYLFCLFPNLERLEFVFHKDLIVDKYGTRPKDFLELGSDYQRSYTHLYDSNQVPSKYLKSPVDMQDVIPTEYATYLASGYIQMLATYCRDAGITFRWATWNDRFYRSAKKYGYLSFVDNQKTMRTAIYSDKDTDKFAGAECHLELLDKYEKNFYIGLDKSGHWGIHHHVHMAEEFSESLQ